MDRETTILAMLEGKEAEAQERDEWMAKWSEDNEPMLLAGELDTDLFSLVAEANADQAAELNQALYLLMVTGDKYPLTKLIQQLMDLHLANEAQKARRDHEAAAHDDMSNEQWDQYQQRSSH